MSVWRSMTREPVGIAQWLAWIVLLLRYGVELWTLPLCLLTGFMAIIVDELWQDRLDARASQEPSS